MKKLLMSGLFTLCSLLSFSQTTPLSFTNKPLSDPEMPNYGRGAQFWNGVIWNNSQAPQVPNGNSTAKTGYRRWWWYEMESAQGVYTFTGGYPSIEWHLKDLADKGMQLSYGSVMTAYDGDGIFYDGANSVYPQYLHNLMKAEPATPDWKYTGTNSWIPNWNSPSYLARWRALQDTIYKFIQNWTYTPSTGPWAGKLVRGKHMLVDADVRGYGNFGEWHTWPWTDYTPANAVATDSSVVKIINATKDAFKDVPLHINVAIFDANPWGDHNPFRAWYALTQRNDWGLIGYRDDGIGDPNKWFLTANPWTYGNWRADTALNNRWKYSLNTGEPLNGSGTCCPYYYDVRNQVTTKNHYAIFGNGNYGSTTQAVWDTMINAFKLAGFRYNINGGNMSTLLSPNQKFGVALNWRNVGYAPLYQNRWKIKYELVDASNVVVQTFTSKFKPFMYLPDNKDSVVVDSFLVSGSVLPGSGYKLNLTVYDTTNLCDGLYLAINSPSRNVNGSYTLRSNITVESTLPVIWYSFNGVNKSSFIELTWVVGGQLGTEKYLVQRSDNAGATFNTIDTILAKSPSSLIETYTYRDYNVTPGVIMYRIKQLDADDNYSYSRTITLSGDYEGSLKISPNPVLSNLTLTLTNRTYGVMDVYIYSSSGVLLRTYRGYKSAIKSVTSYDASSLSPGMYIIKVMIGRQFQGIQRFVKS